MANIATIADRIRKPSADIGKIAACIYGKGGVGKTTLLGTLPGRGLLLDTIRTEGGSMVLSDHADHIDVFPIETWDDFEIARRDLSSGKYEHYGWCSIDSLTGAQALAKEKTLKDRPLDTDPAIISLQEYGKIGELMSQLILKFRALNLHVICTAQERKRDDISGPDVSPATLSSLLPPMYLVGRLYTMEVENEGVIQTEYRLRVGPHDSYESKVRAVPGRALPAVIRNPNLGQIFGYLLGVDVPRPEEVTIAAGIFGIE